MAELNRKALRKIFEDAGMEIPPKDVLGQICDLHTEALDGMNDTIKELQGKLSASEQERGDNDGYKDKYEKEHEAFEAYKSDVAEKETKAAKSKAYRELLKESGVSDKRFDGIIKLTDLDGIELDSDGKIKNADKHAETIKTEWADFIVSTETKGAKTATPPTNNGGATTKTRAEILAIKDTTERQKAIAENPSLFGL